MTLSATDVAAGHRSGLSWPLLIATSTFLVLLTRSQMLGDVDLYWHIIAGRWMFQHLAIPTADPFSYTMPGAPWIAHEWLAEIVYAAAYSLAGWSAVVGLAAAAFAAALAILARYLLRYIEPLYALVLTSMAFSLASPHLLARPHTLVAPLLMYWTVTLLRARESNRAPPLWTALLMVLWANLHGSLDRKSTRLNSSHANISYAVFCLKKKNTRLNSSHANISYAVFFLKKKRYSKKRVLALIVWMMILRRKLIQGCQPSVGLSKYLTMCVHHVSPLVALFRAIVRCDIVFLACASHALLTLRRIVLFFFFNDTAPTDISILSLHYSLFFFLKDPPPPHFSPLSLLGALLI